MTALIELIGAVARLSREYLTGDALWTAAGLLERAMAAAEAADEVGARAALQELAAVPL
jgi:hypothetical protein